MKKLSGFFKRNSYELVMLGWVNGLRYNFPHFTIEKCVSQFFKFYDIRPEDFMKQESACRIFYRIDADLKEQLKTKNKIQTDEKLKEKKPNPGPGASPINPVTSGSDKTKP